MYSYREVSAFQSISLVLPTYILKTLVIHALDCTCCPFAVAELLSFSVRISDLLCYTVRHTKLSGMESQAVTST